MPVRANAETSPRAAEQICRPVVVDKAADIRFRDVARRYAWDPDDPFVGRYVDWEWKHARHVFASPLCSVEGKTILEFGCHFGGTAIVLAALGARVIGIDVDKSMVELARANAARYGLASKISFVHVPDTRRLPFETSRFEAVTCVSVLEYVRREWLLATQREIDRVLAPGGQVIVVGTSNRLWPREVHSGTWFWHYLPSRFLRRPRRALLPRDILRGFPSYTDLLEGAGSEAFAEIKAKMGASPRKVRVLQRVARVVGPLGLSAARLMPTITMILSKPGRTPS